jgi:hypothetical protein
VHSVFFLETVQTILSGADLYYWFASGFGNFNHLTSPFASSFDAPIMGSVVSLCVQFFFVYRIRVLSERSRWLCVIIYLVTSLLKSRNDLIILPIALHCQCIRGVLGGYLCKSPQFRVTQNVSHHSSHTSSTDLWKVYARCFSKW